MLKRPGAVWLLLLLLAAPGGCGLRAPYPAATPRAVARVTKLVFPSVVRIDVKQENYAEGKRRLEAGIGSGVIIDPDGHILTNYHVAGRAAEIFVTLYNKERVPARLIGDDHWTDLAVIRMDMDVIRQRNITFSHATLGSSSSLVTGQDVIAMGTPFGFARTLTLGVVSNTDQTLYDPLRPQRMRIGPYETGDFANWIQMDTPLNPGNSGGPLVDLRGRVVGINTRGGGQNLNFAIPIDIAREVAQKIIATATDQRKGYVERSDLGLDLKPLEGFQTFYNIDVNRGVLVESVERGSPGAAAGVQAQDILLELNGQPTNARFPEELAPLRKRIADLPVGTPVTLRVLRDGKVLTLNTVTERLQSAVGEERELKVWGLSVRDVTRAYANERQLDDDQGVVITSLSPGFPAARSQLQTGDVIVRVNERPATDLDEFMKLYEESIQRQDQTVLLDLRRRRAVQQAVMKITY